LTRLEFNWQKSS